MTIVNPLGSYGVHVTTPTPKRLNVTMRDVATEAGVSRGTVSRVLNGGYVSAQARKDIEAAIRRVGYVPNNAARNLVRQRTQAVAFLVHEPHAIFIDDPNIDSIMLGANEALSEADYQMVSLVIDSKRDSDRVSRYLAGGFVDGAIVVSARAEDPITEMVSRLSLPTVFVGHPLGMKGMSWVGIDNITSARAITQRLMATGRNRVGMIAAALDRDSGADRLEGFRQALGESFDPQLVVDIPLYKYMDGLSAMEELLAREPAIDGIFAASDAVAAGAIEALRAAGRRIPEDVGIVGFDDSSWATRSRPALSTVHQPATGLGRKAAELVLAQLRGELAEPAGIKLDTPIVWRGSA